MTAVPGHEPARILVIGYGNALRSDDGVGWHAAALLARDTRLAGAEVMTCHQLAPELALDMSAARLVVLVDASTAAAPGTITVRRLVAPPAPGADPAAGPVRGPGAGAGHGGDPLAAPGGDPAAGSVRGPGATTHHVDPGLLLALARELYGASPVTFAVSVGVADLGPGEALTPAVAAALPAVADAVAELVAGHLRDIPANPG